MHYALWHQLAKLAHAGMNVDDAVLNGLATGQHYEHGEAVFGSAGVGAPVVQCEAKSLSDLGMYSDKSKKIAMGSLSSTARASKHGPFGPLCQVAIRRTPSNRISSPLDMEAAEVLSQLKVPRNKTALMQQLQLLVVKGNRYWCSGVVARRKLTAFVLKMEGRYPMVRTERGRSYDRQKGLATVHFVAFPRDDETVFWWLLSSPGKGGLADPTSEDARVSKDAMAGEGHIAFGDYVLLYAHKKDARTIKDGRTGKETTVWKDRSTWTWKLTANAFNEVNAALKNAAAALHFGEEGQPGQRPWGLRGILHMQRSRPLFSGVRTQVIALHRHAQDEWGKVQKKWQGVQSALAEKDSEAAGELKSIQVLLRTEMPKMRRIRVYEEPPATIQALIQ